MGSIVWWECSRGVGGVDIERWLETREKGMERRENVEGLGWWKRWLGCCGCRD